MGNAGQLCGEGKQRTQSGQKSPALLFHDTAEMLFQWKVIGSFFWGGKKKKEVMRQLQIQLEPSCRNVGNREGGRAARLWGTAARPGSLGHVPRAAPAPLSGGHSRRGWRCSGLSVAQSCSQLNSCSPPVPKHLKPGGLFL